VSGSGISWAICKSATRSRQITMSALHYSSFLQAGCPSCRPTNSVKALKAKLTDSVEVNTRRHRDACVALQPAHHSADECRQLHVMTRDRATIHRNLSQRAHCHLMDDVSQTGGSDHPTTPDFLAGRIAGKLHFNGLSRRRPPAAISCSYRDTGVPCSVVGPVAGWPGGLELAIRLPARSVTFR